MPDMNHYYDYEPSFTAAVVFIALFAITSLLHTYQMLRTRLWFWTPFVIGGYFEVVGFISRAINANEERYYWSFAPFVIQTLGLLLAPVFFAASMYMMLGRVAELARGENLLLVPRKWLTKIFVSGDILAFLIQCVGGIMLTQQDAERVDTGRKIVLVGLWLQIVFFSLFLVNALLLTWRKHRAERKARTPARAAWKRHMAVLLVGSTLILIRCIYRVIEYQQGRTGYLMTHEIFVYVLDAGLMLAVMLAFHFVHPSEIYALLHGGKMVHLFKIVNKSKEGWGLVVPDETAFPMTAAPTA